MISMSREALRTYIVTSQGSTIILAFRGGPRAELLILVTPKHTRRESLSHYKDN